MMRERIGLLLLGGVSILTAWISWYFGDHLVIEQEAIFYLWDARHQPHDLMSHLLSYWQGDIGISLWFMLLLSTASLLLICWLALKVGLSYQNCLILFLLLNFNPDFNDSRMIISALQVYIFFWTLGTVLFLLLYKVNFYLAFASWFFSLLLSGFFEISAWLWLVFFPLMFLFWPGKNYWLDRLKERLVFFFFYYIFLTLLIVLFPGCMDMLLSELNRFVQRFNAVFGDISLLLNSEEAYSLSFLRAFLISALVVLIEVLSICGIMILFCLYFTCKHWSNHWFSFRMRLFCILLILFSWLLATLRFMTLGTLDDDIYYMPIVFVLTFFASNGIFYLQQKIKVKSLSPQVTLLLGWTAIAYFLCSIVSFGPSNIFLRTGGLWLAQHYPQAKLSSNRSQVLFYAGRDPHQVNAAVPHDWATGDIYAYYISRKINPPPLQGKILQQFNNKHGDRLVILQK